LESVESSNRIEGITVAPERLRPLVIGNAQPRDRSEEEIRGYRRALELIHTNATDLPLTSETLRLLHQTAQEGAGDAGEWKRRDNDIVEYREGHPPRVHFRTVSFKQASAAVKELCFAYEDHLAQSRTMPIVALGCFVFDFLCIHPFRDGNGRVSRLVTLLGLYQLGYEVGRYISPERLVEESREDYYEVLRLSSVNWHEGKHDIMPWLNFFLTVIRRAYRDFEERAGQVKSPRGAKTGMVEAAIDATIGTFRISEIEAKCPGVSRELIRRVLQRRRREGKLTCTGYGSMARWKKKR
jgi:Fic family protein